MNRSLKFEVFSLAQYEYDEYSYYHKRELNVELPTQERHNASYNARTHYDRYSSLMDVIYNAMLLDEFKEFLGK